MIWCPSFCWRSSNLLLWGWITWILLYNSCWTVFELDLLRSFLLRSCWNSPLVWSACAYICERFLSIQPPFSTHRGCQTRRQNTWNLAHAWLCRWSRKTGTLEIRATNASLTWAWRRRICVYWKAMHGVSTVAAMPPSSDTCRRSPVWSGRRKLWRVTRMQASRDLRNLMKQKELRSSINSSWKTLRNWWEKTAFQLLWIDWTRSVTWKKPGSKHFVRRCAKWMWDLWSPKCLQSIVMNFLPLKALVFDWPPRAGSSWPWGPKYGMTLGTTCSLSIIPAICGVNQFETQMLEAIIVIEGGCQVPRIPQKWFPSELLEVLKVGVHMHFGKADMGPGLGIWMANDEWMYKIDVRQPRPMNTSIELDGQIDRW